MIGIDIDDEIDIELYLVNHHRLLNAKGGLREVSTAIKYYARQNDDQATLDLLESIENDFWHMAHEYVRLVARDTA